MSQPVDLAIVGGGAAGFFAARTLEELRPHARILILEKSHEPLRKVAISGGGRCNVTNAEADPRKLVANYPRGARELLGPLHHFGTREAMQWFEQRGVPLKVEPDGRVFPQSDDAQSIVRCLADTGAEVELGRAVEAIEPGPPFTLRCRDGTQFAARRVLVASGGSPRATHYGALRALGHRIEEPVPSLFALHCASPDLRELAGVAVPNARLRLRQPAVVSEGPLLITHRGLSGPAVLRLSAWAARELAQREHRFELELSWERRWSAEELDGWLQALARQSGARPLVQQGSLPRRLWERILELAQIPRERRCADLSRAERQHLVEQCCALRVRVQGQSPNKEEFVTCGGVSLREVDFRDLQSRLHPGLYFAGEILDLDALTGGFNFQAAWTTAWLAARAIAQT